MKNTASILHPNFKYTHSSKTDIKKTFARIYKQMKAEADSKHTTSCGSEKSIFLVSS